MKKTKVLFCSPYSYGENVISGGISIWGKIIVDYSQIANDETLEIIPISFDRKRKVMEVNDFGFKRFYSGFREISKKCKEVRIKYTEKEISEYNRLQEYLSENNIKVTEYLKNLIKADLDKKGY